MKKKWNVLDGIILAAVALALAGGAFFLLNPKAAKGEARALEFDVEVIDITREVAEGYRAMGPVVFGATNSDAGEVVNVKIEPYLRMMRDTDKGIYRLEPFADKVQAVVTIRADATETDDAFTGVKEQIMVGQKMPFRGKGFASGEGFITRIQAAPKEGVK
jgi:hypothetical protein